MGCFDTVMVPCPDCGHESPFQSKGGDCSLSTYSLADAPADVLSDVNRHSPHACGHCGTLFAVKLKATGTVVRISELEDD